MRLILVIESDAATLNNISRDLSGMRQRVVTTGSGRKGLEMARTGNPDAMLLSVEALEMDSLLVLKELRADEITRGIPVLFMTRENTEKERLLVAQKLGVTGFLMVPYQSNVLLESFQSALQRGPRPGPAPKSFKVSRGSGRTLITFQAPADLGLYHKATLEFSPDFIEQVRNDHVIMDLRALPEFNHEGVKVFLKIRELFKDIDPLIVAGRNYGHLLGESMVLDLKLFLSGEELKNYFDFLEKGEA